MNFSRRFPIKHIHRTLIKRHHTSSFSKDLEILQSIPDSLKNNLVKIAQEHVKIQNELLETSYEKDAHKRKAHRLTSEISSLTTQRDYVQIKLNEKTEECRSLDDKLKKTEFSLLELSTERDVVKSELEEKSTLFDHLINENKKYIEEQEKTGDLHKEISSKDETIKLLQKQIHQIMQSKKVVTLEYHEEEMDKKRSIISNLRNKINELKYDLDDLNDNLNASKTKYRSALVILLMMPICYYIYDDVFNESEDQDASNKQKMYMSAEDMTADMGADYTGNRFDCKLCCNDCK